MSSATNLQPGPKIVADKGLENPLSGTTGVVLFVLLILISGLIAFNVSSRFFQSDYFLTTRLQFYVLAITLGWFSFTMATDPAEFFLALLFVGLLAGTVVGMVLTLNASLFWISLILTVGFGIATVLINLGSKDLSEKFLASAYTTWLISGLVVTLGSTRYLPYSTPALSVGEVHYLLDFRYLISGLFLIIFFGKAIMEAFEEGVPRVPLLPDLTVPLSSVPADSIMRPLIIVLNSIFFVVQKTTGAIWYVIATVAIYLYRTGLNLANLILDMLLESVIWLSVFRVIFTFMTVIVIGLLTRWILPSLMTYLVSDTSPLTISSQNLVRLAFLVGTFVVLLSLIVAVCKIWNAGDPALHKAAFAGSMLILVWSLSGGAMYAASRLDLLEVYGFKSVGTYTALIALVVAAALVFQIMDRLVFRIGGDGRSFHSGYSSAVWVLMLLTLSLIVVISLRWSSRSDHSSVNEFYFYYKGSGDSDATRGRHDWTKIDQQTWVERFPTGEGRKMIVVGRLNLDTGTGTLLQNSENTSWEYFIPDKDSQSMQLLMRDDKKPWFVLADMLDVH